jgi:aspartyl-tRNA(Asn)/glutamyl-tRNA(Gln) amidotransferase subunit A
MELTGLTIAQAAGYISRREISPVELTQAHLERIARVDGKLNSFLTVTPELALQQAHQAEEDIQRGVYRGALHGIPLALKDLYETRGVRTTAGSLFFADHVPQADAVAVQKLTAAGAILLGKLNMHEIALGITNENSHFGDCCNPWDTRRVTGGSSGGNGAALAAGLCMGALGSDTGGSIRIPSALCGVVGLKPTYGRVSLRGVIPLSWNLDHAGPMARSVRDTAILLQAIAGYDPQDPCSVDEPVESYLEQIEGGVRGWKIALASDEYFTDPSVVDEQVLSAVRQAAQVFESLGAVVEEVDFPEARQAAQANGVMTTSDAAAFHRQRLAENPDGFGADVLRRLRAGAANTSSDYAEARRTQSVLHRQFANFLATYDLLLTPTTPFAAPLRGISNADQRAPLLTRFTAPFNLTGLPALSIPCGLTQDTLPIGLQMVGAPWAEARVLRAAYAYEQARGFDLKITD